MDSRHGCWAAPVRFERGEALGCPIGVEKCFLTLMADAFGEGAGALAGDIDKPRRAAKKQNGGELIAPRRLIRVGSSELEVDFDSELYRARGA